MVFTHLMHAFASARWFKHSGYIGIISTGLVYGLYTCTVSISCAPTPDSDVDSYINGFRQRACSAPEGANMLVGIIMAVFNSLTDVFLLVTSFLLSPSMNVTVKERQVIYAMHFFGVM